MNIEPYMIEQFKGKWWYCHHPIKVDISDHGEMCARRCKKCVLSYANNTPHVVLIKRFMSLPLRG